MPSEQAGPPRHSHATAPTRFVTADGVRDAYRRFGADPGAAVVFLQHFRGGPAAMMAERAFFSSAGSLRLVASYGSTRSWSPWMTRTGTLIAARSGRKSSKQAVMQR